MRGCVLHRYILFQTKKETVFLIKRHQESQFPSRDIRKSDIEEKRERTRVSEYVSEKEGGREKEGPEGSSAMHPLAQLSGEKRGTSKKLGYPQVPGSIPAETPPTQINMDLSK